GVSVATVSRVINKSGRVSDDLQDRVLDVIEALHYQPGEVTRGLRSHKTRIVGVVVPRIADVFFGTLSTAIEKTLLAAQYRMFMCSAEESEAQEGAYVETFLRYPSEGVILVPTGRNTAHIRRLIEQRIPIVLIDRDLPGMAANRVMSDNHWGAYHGAR